MAEPMSAKPSRALLRAAFAFVVHNVRVFVPLAGTCLVVGIGISYALEPLLKMMGIVYDGAKATDQQFFTYEVIGNLATTLFIYPLWAGLYGVAFEIVREQPNPDKGFSVAWTKFVPVVILGLLTDAISIAIDFGLRKANLGDDLLYSLLLYSVVSAPLMLSLAAMVGTDMGMWQSIVYSFKRFEEHPFKYFSYYVAASLLAFAGVLACGFGILITLPIFPFAMVLLVEGRRLEGAKPPDSVDGP